MRVLQSVAVGVVLLICGGFLARWLLEPRGAAVPLLGSAEATAVHPPGLVQKLARELTPNVMRDGGAVQFARDTDQGREVLALEVLAETSGPIAGAKVYSLAGGRAAVFEGMTGEDGRLEIVRPAELDTLCATADGFATGHSDVSIAHQGPIVLTMSIEGTLSGLVRADSVPFEGAHVFVWGANRMDPPVNYLADAHRGDPRIAWSTTMADGRFEVRGLESGHEYLVAACAPGRAAVFHDRRVRPDRKDIEIDLAQVFATYLRFLDSAGNPIVVPTNYCSLDASVVDVDFEHPVVEPVPLGLERALGTCPEQRRTPVGSHLLLVSSLTNEERVGPFKVRLRFPGYEQSSLEVFVPRFDGLIVAEQRITLRSTASHRGGVLVTLVSSSPASEGVALLTDLYTLHLEDTSGASLALRLPGGEVAHLIDHVPFGSYRWRIASSAVPTLTVALDSKDHVLRVGEDRALVRIDLSNMGGIRLSIRDRNGRELAGIVKAQLLVHDDAKPKRVRPGIVEFAAPPYLIPSVPPGRYTVDVWEPAAREETGRQWPIIVSSGQIETLSFVVE